MRWWAGNSQAATTRGGWQVGIAGAEDPSRGGGCQPGLGPHTPGQAVRGHGTSEKEDREMTATSETA